MLIERYQVGIHVSDQGFRKSGIEVHSGRPGKGFNQPFAFRQCLEDLCQ
jgi:hypothetical protein